MKKLIFTVILLGIFTCVSGAAQGQGRRAILIGIDRYIQEGRISSLRSASSEARKLGQILSQNGYECRIMTDENATKGQITEAFIQIEQQISQTNELDLFLVYFSGRGARIPDDIQADETQDGLDECILPSDAAADNHRSFIRDDALARWVSAVYAKQVILILDCAFWGDETDPGIKGLGDLAEAETLDGIEITDGLMQDVVIISAGTPGTQIRDGAFTAMFLESLVTEEADGDGDRVVSFAEAYQFTRRQLQDKQLPRVVGSKAADIPLAPLPPLSRLQVRSNPSQAQILLYKRIPLHKDSEEVQLDETQYTPAMIPLTKGIYKVQVQKKGFVIPEAKEAAITKYNSIYALDAFQLTPIKVVGQVSVTNSADESMSVADGLLTVHVVRDKEEVHQMALLVDGRLQFAPADRPWLAIGSEYQLSITGKPVLSAEPVSFVYEGHTDINIAMTAKLDDVPPALSAKGIAPQATYLVFGEKIQGTVNAKDDGLGLTDTISVQLQPPDNAEIVVIPGPGIRFQPPGIYEFSHAIPDAPASAGEWSVAIITLEDKAGNKTELSSDQISMKFHVFASRFDLGKRYFSTKDYPKALDHLGQVDPPDDDTHYFIALSHYYLDDLTRALAVFQKIEGKSRYLGKARPAEVLQMPRKMVSRIWGELLDNLDANRTDASYLELLAITAEELGRTYEAKVYREHVERLRSKPE